MPVETVLVRRERWSPSSMAKGSSHSAPAVLDIGWATAGVQRGDVAAFEALYRVWFDRVYSMARALTRRDESFCLDVTQEVMLRVARSIKPMRHERELGAWMGRATVSVSVDLLRRESRRRRREQGVARAEVQTSSDGLTGGESAWLAAQFEALPEAEKALLMERFGFGRSMAEVGGALGLSEDAAHGKLRRLTLRLREMAKEFFP